MLKKQLLPSVQRFVWILLFAHLSLLIGNTPLDDETCEDCHEDVSLDHSIHEDLSCGDCHTLVMETGVEHGEEGGEQFRDVCDDCSECHEDSREEWEESVHGVSLYAPHSEKEAAHCWKCHGGHNILPSNDEDSKTYPLKLAETCGECHAKPELVEKYNIPNLHPVELFSKSFHAIELAKGNTEAATCNDCHKYHDIQKGTDPTSSIGHSNIAETCGECHTDIYQEYKSSVHWEALARGERESPACVDCHGEHEIVGSSHKNSPLTKRASAEKTCSRCHTDEKLVAKYGLSEGKVSSYQDSYHGLAVLKGDTSAATCFDCHNAHAILSSDMVQSSIHPTQLKDTCEKCHPNSSDGFAQSYTHKSVMIAERPAEYYVKIIYYFLIGITIGGMLIHNGIIFVGHIVGKYRREQKHDYIQRYTRSQVNQHFILIISFFMLVITGFALKYQDQSWVILLGKIGMTEAVRALTHRIAAVLMILLSIWHMGELLLTKAGNQFIVSFFPNKNDFVSLFKNIRYYLFKGSKKPEFSRFDYAEKVEYWALIWGTIVMVATGIILWFPIFFGQFSPPWLIKISEALHYYEAWLATLAILIWHFFFVLYHPKEYPMALTWIHGKMSIDEYKEKHADDYKAIMNEIDNYKKGDLKLSDCSFQAAEYIRRHKISSKD